MKNKIKIILITLYLLFLGLLVLYFISNIFLKNLYFDIRISEFMKYLMFLELLIIPIIFIIIFFIRKKIELKVKLFIIPIYSIGILLCFSILFLIFHIGNKHTIKNFINYKIEDNKFYVKEYVWLESCPWVDIYEKNSFITLRHIDSYKNCES